MMCTEEIAVSNNYSAATSELDQSLKYPFLHYQQFWNEDSGVKPEKAKECEEITNVKTSIPEVDRNFNVLEKIGEGTFSKVFLAKSKNAKAKVSEFAIKYIIPTSHPSRITRELQYLKLLSGSCNIIPVLSCMIYRGHVALIMPYFPHDRFTDIIGKLSLEEISDYIKNLLMALEKVHQLNVIHRDVKPSNFLYNRKMKKYALVDFGLAQDFEPRSTIAVRQPLREKSNNIVKPFYKKLKKRKFTPDQENAPPVEGELKKRKLLPQFCSGQKSTLEGLSAKLQADQKSMKNTSSVEEKKSLRHCSCFGKAIVCPECLKKPQEVAARAGTPGYRAPEVLMKFQIQTPALDIWSVGVILLSLLSGRYPFFMAGNDLMALAEIATLLGTSKLQKAAHAMRKLLTFSHKSPPLDLQVICQGLLGHKELSSSHLDATAILSSANDLLQKLLDPNPFTRPDATSLLRHKFLN